VAAATPEAASPPAIIAAAKKEEPAAAPVAIASAAPGQLSAPETDMVTTASVPEPAQPVMAFEQTPQDTSAIGSLIVSQSQAAGY
jgi:hypothetical protein